MTDSEHNAPPIWLAVVTVELAFVWLTIGTVTVLEASAQGYTQTRLVRGALLFTVLAAMPVVALFSSDISDKLRAGTDRIRGVRDAE